MGLLMVKSHLRDWVSRFGFSVVSGAAGSTQPMAVFGINFPLSLLVRSRTVQSCFLSRLRDTYNWELGMVFRLFDISTKWCREPARLSLYGVVGFSTEVPGNNIPARA